MLFHSYICPSSMVLALPRKLYDVSTTTCCSHYLGWEIDPACIQFVTQTFSSVPMGDVAEFDIECVIQHIEAKLQRQDHLAQTSPVSATTPRAPRVHPVGSSNICWDMLGIEHQLRERFRNIPIETVFENVVPHPAVRDNLLELTTPLAMDPIVVDASDSGLIHRKWWTTIPWNHIEEKLPRLTPWSLAWNIDDGWNRLHNPIAAELQQPIITEGFSLPHCLQNDKKLFHCLTTPAPSDRGRTEPRQTGARTTSMEAWHGWEQGHRRYPPWQYESQFLVTLPDGSMSTAPVGLREQLQGLPLNYAATLDADNEYRRSVALGNAWHLPTAIWILFLLLLGTVDATIPVTPRTSEAAPREEEPWWSYSYGPGSWSWSSWSPHSTEWQRDPTAATAAAPAPATETDNPDIAQDTEHELGHTLRSQDPHVQAARRILAAMAPGEAQTVLKFLSALPHPNSVLAPGSRSTHSIDRATQTEVVQQSTAQVQTEDSEPQLDERSPQPDRSPTKEPIGLPLCSLNTAQAADMPIDASETIEWSATSLILLPTIKNRLNTKLPEPFRLLASLKELRAGDHITAAREAQHYTALHSEFHQAPELAVGNWVLAMAGELIAPGLHQHFRADDTFGSFVEAWLVQLRRAQESPTTAGPQGYKGASCALRHSRQLYDTMSWRRGKTFNLRVLLTVANWNPPELASPLLPASRVYNLEDDARQDPGVERAGGEEDDRPSLTGAMLLAVTAQGAADGVVVSTPSRGIAQDSADAGKRASANASRLASLPESSEHGKHPIGLRNCPGKRGGRWRFRQSCPKRRPYRRGTRPPQYGPRRKLGAVLRSGLSSGAPGAYHHN